MALSAQESLDWYQGRWPTEVDNFYLKTRLGLADYQMQRFEAIAKFHALVFLALAYLQYRLVHSLAAEKLAQSAPNSSNLTSVADVIRLHRAEHEVTLLTTVCRLALHHKAVSLVLTKFLRPFSASRQEVFI